MNGIYRSLLFTLALVAFCVFFWSCEESSETPLGGPPKGEVPDEMKSAQGESVTFTGNFIDYVGLSTLGIVNEELGLSYSIDFPENQTRYSVRYNFTVPEDASPKVYDVRYEVMNVSNESITLITKLDVEEVVSYQNIYMAGSFQWWPWEPSVAYSMTIDTENEGWFEH